MFVEREVSGGATCRRSGATLPRPTKRILGHAVQCDGARARIAAFADSLDGAITGLWTVGKMISISLPETRTVGLVYEISKSDRMWSEDGRNAIEVSVELIGEVRDDRATGKPIFDRGITAYPHIGAISHRIRARDLAAVYDLAGRHAVTIGQLSQNETINANIAIDDTLVAPFCGGRNHGCRQVERGVAAVAQGYRSAAGPARAHP